jgi:dihydrofolate reductase
MDEEYYLLKSGERMRKVILQIDLTLDGFIAGSNGESDWVTADEEMNQDASDLLTTADSILLGRVAYQQFADYWPFADTNRSTTHSKIAHQINNATKIIFSKTLEKVTWGTWNNARLVKENIAEEISTMKSLPGKNLLLYAGAGIVSTFMQLGLIDEYRLRVHPFVLGAGMPLFKGVEAGLHLNLVKTKTYKNGAVLLDYLPIASQQ